MRLVYAQPDNAQPSGASGAVPGGPTLGGPTIPTDISTPAPAKPSLPPAAPVKMSFQPEGVVTKAGSPVVVTVHVADAVDLFQAPLRIKYDPKKVKLLAATPGAFCPTTGSG